MNYECKRCFYKTSLKTDMRRHLNKKVKCPRILESYKYNEKELEGLSLTPCKKDILEDEGNNNKKKEMLEMGLNEIKKHNDIDEVLMYISLHKLTKCLFCDAEYSRFYDLKRHIKNTCKCVTADFNKDSDKNVDEIKIQHNIQNITHNNQQITNNITINVYNNTNPTGNLVILPFDQNWDVSKIDDKQKLILFLEDKKYSKTMEEILQNEKNLNIILDKDSDLGLIYKNDVDKFINMKSNDIIDNAMHKIYNHLIGFYDEMKGKGYILSELDSHKEVIEKKFEEFNCNKDKKTKEYVKNILFDIFDKNKEKVIERFIEFSTLDNENNLVEFSKENINDDKCIINKECNNDELW